MGETVFELFCPISFQGTLSSPGLSCERLAVAKGSEPFAGVLRGYEDIAGLFDLLS
jgi:hypothetical protein